jgi:CheY-like chemotaxis protein
MPEQQDGLNFIERCQREYPELDLAVISGDLRELSRAGGGLPENVAVLSKPFTRVKLAALLEELTANVEPKPL